MNSASPMYEALLTLHLIGLAFGIGGATISDAAFAKSIRKANHISVETVNWVRTFSTVVWAGIGLLAISGTGLFLNFYTTARLTTFNFSEKYASCGAAWRTRKLSFLFEAISMVTWYSILVLAMFKSLLHLSKVIYLLIYVVFLAVAIAGCLVLEKFLFLHYQHQKLPDDISQVPLSVLSTYPASKLAELAHKQNNPTNQIAAEPVAASQVS